MAGIIRLLFEEALDCKNVSPEIQADVLDFFGRPNSAEEAENGMKLMPDLFQNIAFDQVVKYKKHVSGGNFNVAAAYVQLLQILYNSLENKTEVHKTQLDDAMKVFTDDTDNEMIKDGIDFTVKLGRI